MSYRTGNLFDALVRPGSGEIFENLARLGPVRIERIISSPLVDGELYDQAGDEWVLLLEGQARLWIEGDALDLAAGDHLLIPAHAKHRVLATSEEPRCLWLAIHLDVGGGDGSAGEGDEQQIEDQ